MPLIPAQSFEFEHIFQWSIRNFHLCPPWEDIATVILSPEIEIRLLDLVPLRLFLEYQGPGNGMVLGVFPEGDPFYDHGASVDIEVRNPATGVIIRSKEVPFSPLKPSSMQSACSVVLVGVDPSMDLYEQTLVLNLSIKTTVKQAHYWTKALDHHQVALSNDLVSMVADTLYNTSDCHMESKDSVSLMAHYSVLKARVPSLFELPNWNEEEKKWETGLTVEAQRTAKFYLYGRLATPVPENQKTELAEFAKLHQLKDFESMLKPHPTRFTMGSDVVVDDVGFNFLTVDIVWVNASPNKVTFPFEHISTRNLELTLTPTPEQSLTFTFKFNKFDIVVPIYMKGAIRLISKSDVVVREYEISQTFKTKSWTFHPQFLNKDLVDRLEIKMIVCTLKVTEGMFDPKEHNEEGFVDAGGDLLIFNNLQALGDELKALYTNKVNWDLELYSGGEPFRVHQAIAMARSPKIREMMLKQREAGHEADDILVIPIKDFDPEAVEKAILYMYSGRIVPYSREVMSDVMEVADYLQLNLLAEEFGEA